MTDEDWRNSNTRCIGERLAGDAIEETDEHGGRIVDDTLLLCLMPITNQSRLFYQPTGRSTAGNWFWILRNPAADGGRHRFLKTIRS